MNYPKMDPAKVKALMEEGRIHLEFVARMYRRQLANGKYFLHEQPATALSWNEKCIVSLLAHSDVKLVVADHCQYGLATPSSTGRRLPALKPAQFLTNAAPLADICARDVIEAMRTNNWSAAGAPMRLSILLAWREPP